MHQDTSDALELLAEALSDNPQDANIALLTFDALPSVLRARTLLAGGGRDSRSSRQSSRVGRAVPNAAGFSIGDTVYFKANTTKYLLGLPVKVVGTNTQSVNVSVPDEPQYRRFAGNQAVRCPNSIVSKTNPLNS